VANETITAQLKELSEHSQLTDLMDYNVAGGSLTDHQAALHWLSSQGVLLKDKQVSLCSGAQHGLMVLINTLTEYGDCIAVENLCYPGIISLADQFGRKLIPLSMDDEGIIPNSLDNACKQYDIKLLIVVASHQNPTASIMSIKRRKAIAHIIKNNDIWMIDDDVYGFLTPNLPAISSFAPDHSFYLSSLSKCIFPGLRVGFIVSPESFKQRVEATIRNTIWMPVPITLALASKLIFSGYALSIQKQQSEIAAKRQIIAKRILKNLNLSSQMNSFHMWLELPNSWTSDHFSKTLEERGVLVSSAEYFKVDTASKDDQIMRGSDKPYVRVSLMAASSDDELTFALNIINQLIQEN
jgi:DNA-binding transcriptional MocR family regulator